MKNGIVTRRRSTKISINLAICDAYYKKQRKQEKLKSIDAEKVAVRILREIGVTA